jgi:hypothetical protein
MTKRSLLTHIILAVVLLAGMAVIVGYGLSSWWRVPAVAVAIALTGSWIRYLTIGGIIGIVGTLTIALPIAMLMAMSYYYDGHAAFADHMDAVGWFQVFAPTVTGVAIVWLSGRLLSARP